MTAAISVISKKHWEYKHYMFNKDTLKKHMSIEPYRMDIIQAYFEKMALEGWEVKEVGAATAYFKKIEPKKQRYAVVYFKHSHKTDEEEAEFIKSCAEKGWQFIDHIENIYVFKATTNYPQQIPVDKREQRKEIIGRYILGSIFSWVIIPLTVILNIYQFGFSTILVDYGYLILSICALYPVIIAFFDVIHFIKWCIRTSGRFIDNAHAQAENLGKFEKLKTASWIVVLALLILNVINYAFAPPESIKISRDQLPISFETIGIQPTADRTFTYQKNSTFLATEETYTDYVSDYKDIKNYDYLSYSIFKNKKPILTDIYVYGLTHKLFSLKYTSGDATEWGAEAVYIVSGDKKIIVVYEDIVFVYHDGLYSKKLNSEDITAIRKALGH